MSSEPSPSPLTSTPEVHRFGKYEVLAKIGAGGMAEIYKCRLSGIGGFDKIVVVKRMLPGLLEDDELVRMFLDEARIAANLTHPNIVQIYEIDKLGDTPYIAMEYARGPTLSRVIRESWKQEKDCSRVVAKVLSEIAGALAHAHNALDHEGHPLSIVHRDVTPHNIVVTAEGAKLLDFGVAKASGRLSHTNAGGIKGKFRYMAPEQLRGDPSLVDGRADVFAVGVCLYLAATGQHAYPSRDELSVLRAAAAATFVPPSKVNAAVDPELERIILWAMDPVLDRRCPNAKALQDALDTYASEGAARVTTHEVNAYIRRLFGDLSTSDHLVWSAYNDEAVSSKRFSASRDGEDAAGSPAGASDEPPLEIELADLEVDPPEVPRRRAGSWWKVGLASAVVLVGALGAALSRRSPPAMELGEMSAASPSDHPSPAKTLAAPPPAEPQRVVVRVESAPAAPAALTKPEKEPAAQGRLAVTSDVPARVLVDGRFVGTTPLKRAVAAATHLVAVEAAGYPTQKSSVTVRAASEAQLTFRLRKREGPAARPVKEPAPGGGAVAAVAAVEPSDPPGAARGPGGEGWLNLRTEPWCEVFLNGERLGTTPLNRLVIPAGTHALKLVNESAKIERTVQVEIRAGQESTTRLRLEE